MELSEKLLVSQIKARNRIAFEIIFNEYFLQLARFAEGMLFDSKLADDLVQDLFLNLWKNAENLTIDRSVKGYLYTSIRNKCLNELKKLQIHDKNLLQYEGILNSGMFNEVFNGHPIPLNPLIYLSTSSVPP